MRQIGYLYTSYSRGKRCVFYQLLGRQTGKIGTAYVIERNGIVFEAFEPQYWAWQFGLKSAGWNYEDRVSFEKRFIGIEIASEGALKESDGKLYCYDRISSRTEKPRNEALITVRITGATGISINTNLLR